MTPLKQQISLIPFLIEHWRRRFENRSDQTFFILLSKDVLSVNLHSVTRPIAYYYYYLLLLLLLLLLPPSIRRMLFDRFLSFFHSFCHSVNRITDERGNGRRPNLARACKRWPSRSGWLLVVIRICVWIPVFHFLRHWGIGDFPTFVAFLCFLSSHSHTINSRFEPNLAKWMTPTNVSTILERIFDGPPDPD